MSFRIDSWFENARNYDCAGFNLLFQAGPVCVLCQEEVRYSPGTDRIAIQKDKAMAKFVNPFRPTSSYAAIVSALQVFGVNRWIKYADFVKQFKTWEGFKKWSEKKPRAISKGKKTVPQASTTNVGTQANAEIIAKLPV